MFETVVLNAFKATATLQGEAVTYESVGGSTVTIAKAVRGSTFWDADGPRPPVRVGDNSTDWLIVAGELTDDDGNQIEPQRGDEIKTAKGETFRVLPQGRESKLWTWVDRTGQKVRRIYTRERN